MDYENGDDSLEEEEKEDQHQIDQDDETSVKQVWEIHPDLDLELVLEALVLNKGEVSVVILEFSENPEAAYKKYRTLPRMEDLDSQFHVIDSSEKDEWVISEGLQ